MARMAERGNSDGMLATVEMPTWQPDEVGLPDSALVLVTDGIEIPGNLGTLIRTLDACNADLLIMTNRRTRMSHPKVLRGSQGMSVRVPHIEFAEVGEAIRWLETRRFTVYLADTDEGMSYRALDYDPRLTESWDLIVFGTELATAYSELVDPVVQRQRLEEQSRRAAGDPAAMQLDEDFLEALEYGMPPSGGMGMGIDRLLMALTGLGIRDTILFPLVRRAKR